MNATISGGLLRKNRIVIKETMLEWFGIIRRCVSQTLLNAIPSFLVHMLGIFILMGRHWKNWLSGNHRTEGVERRVYDLGNCGIRNQFMVGNLIAHNCQYGAGVGKVMETLEQQDVFLSEDQVLEIHAGYWNLFRQVKSFGYDLQKEWKRNGGYVVNGRGRPMCLTEEYKHDVLNRFIQSTGHDILVDYCYVIKQVLDESGIPWAPKIWDWHDSVMVEVPEDAGEEVSKLFLVALARLNDKLGGTIKLKGTPTVGYNLADVKEPES